jgi:hypothetical protein
MAKAVPKKHNSDVRASVEADKERLGAYSRSDLMRDDERKSASPLGYGSHSKEEKKKGQR